jgi:PilZ domain
MSAIERRHARRRMLKSGLICFNARSSSLPCTVRDISDNGAKLTVADPFAVPAEFELYIELDGLLVSCAIAWRRATAIGVFFTSPVELRIPARSQTMGSAEPVKRKPATKRIDTSY